ncbi:MAG: hypothetical protein M3N39_02260 [Pseudomonadota bacterium]|nr:hypothetical protein [Pseudomonadota bacterium]
MRTALLAAAALALFQAAPASAQSGSQAAAAAPAGPDDVRVNQLIVYGTDPCPVSADEITVCARRPEADRYRIPEPLRDREGPASDSWANRALELQYVGRTGIQSCSTVGPGGATGCLAQLINQARAERRGADQVDWNAMIEQARQERLSRIDEQSEAIEREQSQPR